MNQNLIKKFEQIRDLPYEIGPLYYDEKLITYGKGGCGPKNITLAKFFSEAGYKTKVCWTPYQWKELKALPKELKNHSRSGKIGNHIYMKLKIDKNWALVDASWDTQLSPTLSVNLNWDGKSDQVCAVKIKEETCMNYPEPYLTWRKQNQEPFVLHNLDRDFKVKINRWFELVRRFGKYKR